MKYIEKLASIRQEMKEKGVDAYIIPSSDPHISEYLPDRYKCIAWTSGFTGSAGTLAITQDFAGYGQILDILFKLLNNWKELDLNW
ncbi:aminopeptidase P family N-terminal domain-containing protein [Sphingobacterium daejeonense]|uniref:aminopeptidase P family N-terminal domain-containing protein n=1 Tax=Sphingobacterium daejeonense TaxID=371142 RepID=UPI0010C59592|nr:aminopeptidase P family N-terminal domain-containing protein [Sphingobacterium daejeonense]VTP88788.1 Creatinase/Prolidase N-terminal domain [Sphingobacterium daejeonense]